MSICLNMIVRNEEKVLSRCLESIKHLIQEWVIVDTGSTDFTKELIIKQLGHVPGTLYERDWVDFGHNRNEALQLAKQRADYLMLIDADDYISFDPTFSMPPLTKDIYILIQKDQVGGVESRCPFLLKSSLPWRWEGVIHEGLVCSEARSAELLQGAVNIYGADGYRSQGSEKLLEYIEILTKEHSKYPEDTKTVFYLAESYRGSEQYPEAIVAYEKRIALGGFPEEIFWSFYCIAKMKDVLGFDVQIVLNDYIKAHSYRPSRMEPIYDLIILYRKNKLLQQAYQLSKLAHKTAVPSDVMFVSRWIYEWGILWQYALCCFDLQLKEEYLQCKRLILSIPSFPEQLKKEMIGYYE
ncbi:MAG: glycosyltransferase [Chlamydiales bacterium]|nr:glycosyltransferase [Chlamydiales bacterium]